MRSSMAFEPVENTLSKLFRFFRGGAGVPGSGRKPEPCVQNGRGNLARADDCRDPAGARGHVFAGTGKAFACSGRGVFAAASPGGRALRMRSEFSIRMMSRNNPRWGAPRIHGELLKLGIDITEPTVAKYMVRSRKPPSQSWRTFLHNHAKSMVSVDFFVVPTVRFQILYVFLVLAHDRRRIVHFGVTAHPTAEWTAQQLREAFPWDSAPRHLLRDRDRIFGHEFT